MTRTKIEWVKNDDGSQGQSWNPVTGCLHGCSYCYARRIAERFSLAGAVEHDGKNVHEVRCPLHDCNGTPVLYPFGFEPTLYHYRLLEVQALRKRRTIFVCSMADLLGAWVPAQWIQAVIAVMRLNDQHRYLLLTKNPRRYAEFAWPDNCWLGTSCEDQAAVDERIPYLLVAPAAHRFVSLEPLLGGIFLGKQWLEPRCSLCGGTGSLPVPGGARPCPRCLPDQGFDPDCLSWIIVGAQTGPSAKQPDPAWVDSLVDQCRAAGVPVFCKDNLQRDLPQEVPS